MRKAIFGVVVIGLLIWAVQFMRSSQTDNADAVIPAPALSQDAPAAIIETPALPSTTSVTVVEQAPSISTDAAPAASETAPATSATTAPATGTAQ